MKMRDSSAAPPGEPRMDREHLAALRLSLFPNIGTKSLLKLFEYAGKSYAAAASMSEAGVRGAGLRTAKLEIAFIEGMRTISYDDARRKAERMIRAGIRFLLPTDGAYPERLRNIPDPPLWLYVIGRIPDDLRPSAAVIGARACSPYGREEAVNFGKLLARYRIQLVSGLAYGIDSISQEAALRNGGDVFAVLGSGVNVCYPETNHRLYDAIADRGGLISEYPIDSPADKWRFPMRNRLISGLADLIIVVEARKKSGTLITADLALDQGKEVFACPGYRTLPLSEGTNRLIRTGAGIITSEKDILDFFHLEPAEGGQLPSEITAAERNAKIAALANTEKKVYSAIGLRPVSTDEILRTAEVPPDETLRALYRLERLGLIDQPSNQYYRKR